MKHQRGIVLLLALILSLLLGLLAASALRDAMVEVRMAGYLSNGLKAFEEAEAVLLAGEAELHLAPPQQCQVCLPPSNPHDLQGQWQASADGYFQLQNLGESTRALHMPKGEPVTLYRITAVSRQAESRQVLESIYAIPAAQTPAPQRILWRQRLRED